MKQHLTGWTMAVVAAGLVGGVAFAQVTVTPAKKASVGPQAQVGKYLNDGCSLDDGKVAAKLLDGQDIKLEKKGCLTILGKDGKTYYVRSAVARIDCKEPAKGSVATVTAGSAAATEGCKR